MIKVFHVAMREFITTLFTRAFLLGIVLPPAIMAVAFTLMPILMNKAAPKVEGHIAIIDQSGQVAPRIEKSFSPEEIAKRRADKIKKATDSAPIPDAVKKQMEQSTAQAAAMLAQASLSVRVLPESSDVEAEKAPIRSAAGKEKDAQGSDPRLVLAVIPKSAVAPGQDAKFTGFDLFTAPRLDPEVQDDVERQVSRAIVDARIESRGLKVADVRGMTESPRINAKAVTAEGDKKTSDAAKMLVPGAFLMLLWISVFTCGNYLLTSTIEEKSTRVMEVLLSAVSPMQLMTGKIVGQMCVGLVILLFYAGAGMMGLVFASMAYLVDPMNLVYLGVFFIIAFALIASLMAAVGAAVSDIKEAQSLLGPIMIVLIIPMVLWFPILRNPNSMFAQVCSFVPPISPFIMVLRLAGSEPVKTWQIVASIVAGFFYVFVFLWAAAKVFRIGVLMYGKPPNFRTLLRWVRMA